MLGATPAPRFPFQRYGRGRPRRCCCRRPVWILRVPAPSFCSLASMFSVLWLSLSGFPSNLKKTKQNTAFYHPAIQVWYNHGILSGDLGYYFKNTFSVISMGVVAGRDKIAYLAYLLDLTILTPFKYVIFLFEKIFLKIPKMYKSRENSPVNPRSQRTGFADERLLFSVPLLTPTALSDPTSPPQAVLRRILQMVWFNL